MVLKCSDAQNNLNNGHPPEMLIKWAFPGALCPLALFI